MYPIINLRAHTKDQFIRNDHSPHGKNDILLSKTISTGHFIMFNPFHTSSFWTWICRLFEKLYLYDKVALCYSPKIALKVSMIFFFFFFCWIKVSMICVMFHAPSSQIEAFCKKCHSYLSFFFMESVLSFLFSHLGFYSYFF